MNKKIIGYKSPIDLFNGKILAGTIYKEGIDEVYFPINCSTNDFNLPKEIVKT